MKLIEFVERIVGRLKQKYADRERFVGHVMSDGTIMRRGKVIGRWEPDFTVELFETKR